MIQKLALPFAFTALAAITTDAQAALTMDMPEEVPHLSEHTIQKKCQNNASFYIDGGPFSVPDNDGFASFYNCANSIKVNVTCSDLFTTWTLSALNPHSVMREEFMKAMTDHCPREGYDALMMLVMEDIMKFTIKDAMPAMGFFVRNALDPLLER